MASLSEHLVALVADDHELFRAGAASVLMRDCGFHAVVEAGSLDEALARLGEDPSISLACLDLGMPGVGNPVALSKVRERFPQVRLAVVTGSDNREDIFTALQAGVHGYVPKTLGIAEMTRAFQIVKAGGIYVPRTIADLPASRDGARPDGVPRPWAAAPQADGPLADVDLTQRQRDVLQLIRSGSSNKEIGWRLGLSENTVKVHTSALYKRLRVHNRLQAAGVLRSPVDRVAIRAPDCPIDQGGDPPVEFGDDPRTH